MVAETKALAIVANKSASVLPREDEFTRMVRMAELYAKSGILPKGVTNMAAAALVIEQGFELGIPPAAALRTISLVEGKPTLDASMQRALIFRDHGDDAIRFIETTAAKCVVQYKRKGWREPSRFTLTIGEIPQKLRSKDNWQNYTANMLRARATTFVAVMAFSDSTLGLYTPEELGAEVEVGPDGEPHVIEARVVDQDGVVHEPSSISLPWGVTPESWARFQTEATAKGVEISPLMTPDEIAGAIRTAGGPSIPGKVTPASAWEALKHVNPDRLRPDDEGAESHLKAIASEKMPIEGEIAGEAPIFTDEEIAETAARSQAARQRALTQE